jgi:hypothetical protein
MLRTVCIYSATVSLVVFTSATASAQGGLGLRDLVIDDPFWRHKVVFWLLFLIGAASTIVTSTLAKREWWVFGTKLGWAVEALLVALLAGASVWTYLETAVWAAPLALFSGAVTGAMLVRGIVPVQLIAILATVGNVGLQLFALDLFDVLDTGLQMELAVAAAIQLGLLILSTLATFTGRRSVDPDLYE